MNDEESLLMTLDAVIEIAAQMYRQTLLTLELLCD